MIEIKSVTLNLHALVVMERDQQKLLITDNHKLFCKVMTKISLLIINYKIYMDSKYWSAATKLDHGKTWKCSPAKSV